MSTRVIYEFQKQLKFYRQQLNEHLTQGVENHEEYKYILGKIHMVDICQK